MTDDQITKPDSVLDIHEMQLLAVDIRVGDRDRLTDLPAVRDLLYEAARAGGATILGEEFVSFPNGALTGVLVLAQSHLSIHTWPELHLANIDLLSYGTLRADAMIDILTSGLRARAINVTRLVREVPRLIGALP